MFLFLMIALILSLPILGEQPGDDFDSNSEPAVNNLVAEILENVVFLNTSDYLPKNYVYMEKDVDVQKTNNKSGDMNIISSESTKMVDDNMLFFL